ncbi:MAG: DUF4446 family protein [Caldicoprobacterales bacterium]|jgi:signal transduction histidine kinase
METLYQTLNIYKLEIILITFFLALLSAILVIINFRRTTKTIRRYKKLMRGMDNKNLESMLLNHLDTVEKVDTKINKLDKNVNNILKQLESCIQNVGMVRYNPFDHMGSDLSFSVALLNQQGDGVVLTGLYSRESSAIFAKPIVNMKSKYPLSDEEKQAIDLSIKSKNV